MIKSLSSGSIDICLGPSFISSFLPFFLLTFYWLLVRAENSGGLVDIFDSLVDFFHKFFL